MEKSIFTGGHAPSEYVQVAAEGFEQDWIKTISGEGWFTLPRLYAPLEPILDKTWRWNDIERTNFGIKRE